MATIGEEIDSWIEKYFKADKIGKYVMRYLAAAEVYKAEKIWEFVQTQPSITKEEAFEKKVIELRR